MFRLLSGTLVHETESTHESVVIAATQPVRSLASVAPSLSASLVALVDRALKSDPSDRWPSAIEMQTAVRTERKCLHSSALPCSSRDATMATLDEAMSVAATANEVRSQSDDAGLLAHSPRFPRWWLSSVYGALAALVLLWIVGGRTERAPPASPLAPSAQPNDDKRTPSLASSGSTRPSAIASVAPRTPPPNTTAKSVQHVAASSATKPTSRGETRGTKPSTITLPSSSAASAPSNPAPSSPRRLEDVLDERN